MVIDRIPPQQRLVLLAALVVLLAPGTADAQTPTPTHRATNPETTAKERATKEVPAKEKEVGPKPMSKFGQSLSTAEARALLGEMQQLTEQALAASRAAEQAASVADVKAGADRVLRVVWGSATARGAGDGAAEIEVPGWKERWQVTGGEWSPAFGKRNGTSAPRFTDPRQLGAMGRGRAVRGRLMALTTGNLANPTAQKSATEQVVASLSNVIGWTYITDGLKGNESQPRISLTYVWDAPASFWQSSSDTGWLDEVFAQAANILKTDYGTDVAEARRHAAGMSELLQKVLAGVDADRNGTVEPKMMEGGLNAALRAAGEAGL
jgi:hypothetical protein